MRHRSSVRCAAVLSLLPALGAAADTLRVPTDHPTIQAAIDAAVTGDTVEVLPGTYAESIIIINKSIDLRSSSLDPGSTIITGDGSGERLVRIQGGNATLRFRGFGVRGATNGAVEISDSAGTIEDCRFHDNAGPVGAGLFVGAGTPTIRRVRFDGNQSSAGSAAMYLSGTSALVTDCTIEDNTAQSNVVFVFGGDPTIRNTTLARNSATAAVWINANGGVLGLHGVTITGQSGSYAALSNPGTTMNLVNCAIVDNPELSGPTVADNGFVGITNSILHGNPGPVLLNGGALLRYSLVEGGHSGAGNIDGDPLFRDRTAGDFRLEPGSPCIDAGDTAAAAAVLAEDAAGGPRFVDDANIPNTGLAGSAPMVDIGPDERDRDIRYVRANAPGAGDGLSWATAMADLQDAIDDAASGEVTEIWVAAGTYRPDRGSGDRNAAFGLESGVAWRGGFTGDEVLRRDRNPRTNLTTLSGDIGAVGVVGDNAYHVIAGDEVIDAVVDGFRITGGMADGVGTRRDGGGFWISESEAVIRDCRFEDSRAIGGGAAIFAQFSELFVASSTFTGGISIGGPGQGGAVVVDDAVLAMLSCVLNGNATGDRATVSGSGGSIVALFNCTLVQNSGDGAFAGVGVTGGSTLTVGNSIIWDNLADQPQTAARVQIAIDQPGSTSVVYSVVQDFDPAGIDTVQMVEDVDPRFVDAAGADGVPGTSDDDLRLSQNSCVIDQGAGFLFSPELFPVDVAGNPRRVDDVGSIDGSAAGQPPIDVGAHEFAGGSCRTDFDGSGITDFVDVLEVLSDWGTCDPCTTDVNCNGVVDFGDLLEVLSRWGFCLT